MEAQEFMTLREAFDIGLIPKEFEEIFPDMNCKWCGKPLRINGALTILRCDNSECIIRLARGLVKVLSNLGVKGLGDAKVLEYISKRHAEAAADKTIRATLERVGVDIAALVERCTDGTRWQDCLEPAQYNEVMKLSSGIKLTGASFDSAISRIARGIAVKDIGSTIDFLAEPPEDFAAEIRKALGIKRTFAEAVRVLAIPDMVERADILFGDCDSYEDFLDKMRSNGGLLNFMQTKVVKTRDSKLGRILLARVSGNASDLRRIPEVFSLTTSKGAQLDVVITGNITQVQDKNGGHYTKREFIQLMNEELADTGVRLILRGRVSRSTRFLICDTGGTSNLEEALHINEQRAASGGTEPEIAICTSADFLGAIMDMCGRTVE